MALIIIGTDKRCTCSCASKCVGKEYNSGMGARCTKEELENAGHHTVELNSEKDDKIIQDFLCIDGDEKKIRLDLVRNGKVRRKFLF
jgi:hypothetical protein